MGPWYTPVPPAEEVQGPDHWTSREVLNFYFCDDDTSFKGYSPTEPKLLLRPELARKLTSSQLYHKLQFVFGAGLTLVVVLGDLANTCKPEAGGEGGRAGRVHTPALTLT